MLSRKTIEAYLFFLLRHKMAVSLVVAAFTIFLAWTTYTRLVVQPDFQSLYPPNHPYIQLYNAYRHMFGTAFQVQVVVEVKNGTIFDDPATVQKVDRITLPLLHPRVPENAEDLAILRQRVYTTENVHGAFVSEDDKATQIRAGFWEEYFDVQAMYHKLQEIVRQESDANTVVY